MCSIGGSRSADTCDRRVDRMLVTAIRHSPDDPLVLYAGTHKARFTSLSMAERSGSI